MKHIVTDWMVSRYGDIVDHSTLRSRHNKTAQGMTKTARRSRHSLTNVALTLAVKGTTARTQGIRFYTERSKCLCPCCDQPSNKLRLNAHGRIRLANLRNRAAKRRTK